jgi:hypothetical protein
MIDRHLARGLFLMAIALAFGLQSFHYSIGSFGRPGPGMFPLIVSSMLLLIDIATVVRSRMVQHEKLQFNFRNIGLIVGSLVAFVLVSRFVNMTLGIAAMVFIAGFAATSYSWVRNLKIAVALIAVAFAFHKFLGLNLPLY